MDLKGTIVFSSGDFGDYDIWTLNLETKKMQQLTSGAYWNDCPKWSPDGSKIVFISNRTGTPEIWLMNSDGSKQERITTQNKWQDTPDWSPDGRQFVFCANYHDNIDIYTMNIDGTHLTQITDYEGMDFTPQFSPDGQKIVFSSKRSGNTDLWLYEFATKKFQQLTSYPEEDHSPAFSPDGTQIVFITNVKMPNGSKNFEIFCMDQNGQNVRPLTNNWNVDRFVAWSPDGKYLIYTATQGDHTDEHLRVMELKSHKTQNVQFERSVLANEEGVAIQGAGLFQFLPKTVLSKMYPSDYLGQERFPDWK